MKMFPIESIVESTASISSAFHNPYPDWGVDRRSICCDSYNAFLKEIIRPNARLVLFSRVAWSIRHGLYAHVQLDHELPSQVVI
jgi:hypothetical protein